MGDRYKIYIEGSAWSVSEKYILACDSMTLVVTPKYYDFYSRVLMPMQHYWPIWDDNKCSSIKYAVDWGNSHKQKVSFCVHLYYISTKASLHYLAELIGTRESKQVLRLFPCLIMRCDAAGGTSLALTSWCLVGLGPLF